MIGRVFVLVKWAVIGAVAIVIGSELLRSASVVALSLKAGNVGPFAAVLAMTVGLLAVSGRVSRRAKGSRVPGLLMDIAAYACTIYLFLITLLSTLSLGVVVALGSAACTALLVPAARNPRSLHKLRGPLVSAVSGTGLSLTGVEQSIRPNEAWRAVSRSSMGVVAVPPESRDVLVTMLRERPLLPVSLTHLEGGLFLVVSGNDRKEDWKTRLLVLLDELGVKGGRSVSPLLREAVLALPILDSMHGFRMSDYVLAVDLSTVERLIQSWPERMTIFPDPHGLRALVRRQDAAGLNTRAIPRGCEVGVLVGRDLSVFDEGVQQIEA